MRYALIGCGRIARTHIEAAKHQGLQIVALCDTRPEAIEELIREMELEGKDIHRYTSYRMMLDTERLDVVAVTTESGSHYAITMDCLAHAIPTFVEKPMALDLSQADAMIQKADKKNIQLCVCQQNRFNDASQLVRKALDRGAFGIISHGSVSVRWCRAKDYYDQGSWRGTWAHDGGALMNQSIHGLDLLRWFLGSEITSVEGHLANRYHPYLAVEDVGMAFVRFANGTLATMEGTTNVQGKNLEETLTIIGEKGTVRLRGEAGETIDIWDFQDPIVQGWKETIQENSFASVYGNGHDRVYADMMKAIKEHRQPYVSGKSGRDALELVLAIYKSHKENSPVTLPLKDFSTLQMEGTFPFAND